MPDARALLAGLPNEPGIYEVADDARVVIVEASSPVVHAHILRTKPEDAAVEQGFTGGPVFAFLVRGGTCDIDSGAVFDRDGRPIRESFGTSAVMQRYLDRLSSPPVAQGDASTTTLLPLATSRSANFCRWWLDSMTKPFIIDRAGLGTDVTIVSRPPKLPFQDAGIKLLGNVQIMDGGPRFLRGDIVNTPGVTYGGGQRIGKSVIDFATRIMGSLPDLPPTKAPRIYISRKDTSIRKVVDEDLVFGMLEQFGFVRVDLAALQLVDQIRYFSQAELIVSPHGAGLTNIIWSRPTTKLVEIFPEGGLHGSAFLRIASQKGMPYYAFVAAAGENKDRSLNPNNSDIIVDRGILESFLRENVLADPPKPM